MNGRVYDYDLGRFLSVDPIIQFPANSQSLNPYSYIMNNPLSGTDPTGYLECDADGRCDLTDIPVETLESVEILDDNSVIITTSDGETFKVNTVTINMGNGHSASNIATNVARPSDIGSEKSKSGNAIMDSFDGLSAGDIAEKALQNTAEFIGDELLFTARPLIDSTASPYFKGVAGILDGDPDAIRAAIIGVVAGKVGVPKSVKLTGKGRKKIGNLADIKDKDAAEAIIHRGGTGSNVRKALGDNLKGKTVGEIANLAAEGDTAAETALKIIKQASKKGQR